MGAADREPICEDKWRAIGWGIGAFVAAGLVIVQIGDKESLPPISGWVCRCAMTWLVLHAPVGR